MGQPKPRPRRPSRPGSTDLLALLQLPPKPESRPAREPARLGTFGQSSKWRPKRPPPPSDPTLEVLLARVARASDARQVAFGGPAYDVDEDYSEGEGEGVLWRCDGDAARPVPLPGAGPGARVACVAADADRCAVCLADGRVFCLNGTTPAWIKSIGTASVCADATRLRPRAVALAGEGLLAVQAPGRLFGLRAAGRRTWAGPEDLRIACCAVAGGVIACVVSRDGEPHMVTRDKGAWEAGRLGGVPSPAFRAASGRTAAALLLADGSVVERAYGGGGRSVPWAFGRAAALSADGDDFVATLADGGIVCWRRGAAAPRPFAGLDAHGVRAATARACRAGGVAASTAGNAYRWSGPSAPAVLVKSLERCVDDCWPLAPGSFLAAAGARAEAPAEVDPAQTAAHGPLWDACRAGAPLEAGRWHGATLLLRDAAGLSAAAGAEVTCAWAGVPGGEARAEALGDGTAALAVFAPAGAPAVAVDVCVDGRRFASWRAPCLPPAPEAAPAPAPFASPPRPPLSARQERAPSTRRKQTPERRTPERATPGRSPRERVATGPTPERSPPERVATEATPERSPPERVATGPTPERSPPERTTPTERSPPRSRSALVARRTPTPERASPPAPAPAPRSPRSPEPVVVEPPDPTSVTVALDATGPLDPDEVLALNALLARHRGGPWRAAGAPSLL